jgi:hypothetical protein
MTDDEAVPPLPPQLAELLGDGGAGRALSVALPAGRLVWPDPDYVLDDQTASVRPAYWLSDAPAPNGLWARLRSEHARSGLWPLLLAGMDSEPARPWVVGEVTPESAGDVDGYDAAAFLSEIWAKIAEFRDDQGSDGLPHLAPFGTAWPGLAARGTLAEDPGELADHHAEFLKDGTARLGLVAADRSADALAITGWDGPINYSDATSPLAAVVRSWEDRFGVRVVRIGFDTLDLSVAAPPVTPEHAQQVAAEHYTFCPDNIDQGAGAIATYAEAIRGQKSWSFWWD